MLKALSTKLLPLVLLVGMMTLPLGKPARLQAASTAYDCTAATGLPQAECKALVAIYTATGGAEWKNNTGWLASTAPCTWYGITCASEHVTSISLPGNNLRGPLPSEIAALTGLTRLFLYDNALTALPPEIGNLSGLQTFSLYRNALTALPPEIGNLSGLRTLELSGNALTALPPEIGNLNRLQELLLSDNSLTVIPAEIGNLAALQTLDLSGNDLAVLPSRVDHLTALTDLSLENNALTTLPPEIGNLAALTELELAQNALVALPPEIGNLSRLRILDLSYNGLTALPPEFANLSALQAIGLAANAFAAFPSELQGLPELRTILLDDNHLTVLPAGIGAIPKLYYLSLMGNALTTLPPEIGDLSELAFFYLSSNALATLPPEFGNLPALRELYLANNALTALPPEFGNLYTLENLNLADNALTALPYEFTYLANLDSLYLPGNPLSGEIPAFLTEIPDLSYFSFYATDWCVPESGAVPEWLADMESVHGSGLICDRPTASLCGAVTLPGAAPAAGMQVNLYYPWGWARDWRQMQTTFTDSAGAYRFDGLGQGIGYRVQFVDPVGRYFSEYYDNSSTFESSTPLTATLGMTLTGIDAELAPVAVHFVKSAAPAVTLTNGSLLTYTLVISTDVAATLRIYDPLDEHLSWQGFVGDAPATFKYDYRSISGVATLSATTPLTVSFAVRVNVPDASFVSEYAQVANTAYYYFDGEFRDQARPSNTVVRVVRNWSQEIFLPLVLRGL